MLPSFTGGVPVDAVKAAFARIESHIALADPLLIYLQPSNIHQALTGVHRERGEPWTSQNVAYVSNCPWARSRGLQGRQAIIELYRAWEGLVDELLATSSCATLLHTRYRFQAYTAIALLRSELSASRKSRPYRNAAVVRRLR